MYDEESEEDKKGKDKRTNEIVIEWYEKNYFIFRNSLLIFLTIIFNFFIRKMFFPFCDYQEITILYGF